MEPEENKMTTIDTGSSSPANREPAITVRNAYKRYGPQNVILKGLNMTVPEGSIYGLLGPSGCGKTTLLSCIVGRNELDSGEITVKSCTRREIGYMPQELAIYQEFSIYETLAYYGFLFGMTKKQILKRTEELLEFLELPPRDRTVDTLSGGQQRRLSFSIALLHDPKLLILDEPTVGVDPVLSHSIWQHLVMMTTQQHKTVIITTHYIEEARQAHTIGLMRGGILLAEEPPLQLIMRNNSSNLEQAFLELSKKQSATGYDDDNSEFKDYPPKTEQKPTLKSDSQLTARRVRAQLAKTMYWMQRNLAIMAFLIVLPIVQCVLFNLTIGRDPLNLHLAVVDEELENGLAECDTLPVHGCYIHLPLSCRYLDRLKEKTIKMIEFEDIESARHAVEKNDAWGLLYFSNNYSESLMERLNYSHRATDEALDWSEINIWMDMSNQYIGNLLKRDLIFTFIDFLKSIYSDCGWPARAAGVPIDLREAVYGQNNPSFVHFTAPAIIGLFVFYLPMMFTVGAILMEKRSGILERTRVAGMTMIELMTSHIFVQFLLLALQTAIMMVILFVIFDNPLVGSISLALGLLALIGVNGMCYGFMCAVICDSEIAATLMGLGSFFPLVLLSGMVWPMEGMHYVLRWMGWLLPLTLSTESFRAISARNWPFSHPSVWRGFVSQVFWIIYFLSVTFVIVKLKKGLRGAA
ncbi:ABC transporter G family member 23 [Nilaparvata lugens]|uniref:ABC transporter G family member 23 n=1 Tax=Nilaparvata lugens TaxID=108931 RepID=UPI00193CE1B4|nr:ABC transporter G family member 23 [Nilaparvata lugens]